MLQSRCGFSVTPYAGVWIEIIAKIQTYMAREPSLPTRECGLKFYIIYTDIFLLTVTPYAGVWIEIFFCQGKTSKLTVTPYAGVWIEISMLTPVVFIVLVTPYAGVWIEISLIVT